MPDDKILFTGSIPENYEKYLGPFIFEPSAIELVKHINKTAVHDILETACGTGRVTKHLYRLFGNTANIIASDFSESMLSVAQQAFKNESVKFIQADVQALPFKDNSFDAVICQFGVMFLPDKPKAFTEAYRVLRKGGMFLFSTWHDLAHNPATNIVNDAVTEYFKEAAPAFFYLPHSMHKEREMKELMFNAGFSDIVTEPVTIQTSSPSAMDIAKGFVTGTPMFAELMRLDTSSPQRIIEIATRMLIAQYGSGTVHVPISAFITKGSK